MFRGGTRLERINHATETDDGQYYGNFLGWRSRSKFLQDVIEVQGGMRYVDQVCICNYDMCIVLHFYAF